MGHFLVCTESADPRVTPTPQMPKTFFEAGTWATAQPCSLGRRQQSELLRSGLGSRMLTTSSVIARNLAPVSPTPG